MENSVSTAKHWQMFWAQDEKRISLDRRKICFDRAIFILSQLPAFQEDTPTIYDLGCGFAEVSKYFLLEIPRARLVAVDWSDLAVEMASRNLASFHDRCDLEIGDCCNDDDFLTRHKEKADIILSLGVVEHFSDPTSVLRRQIEVLKKGGILVLMVPNSFSIAPLSRYWKQFTGSWEFGYQREYTPRTLRRWCEDQGLVVLSEHVIQRAHVPQGDWLLKVLSWFEHIMASVIPGFGFYSYVFAVKPFSA